VKIWRRLQRLGAVGIKNSVYVLPAGEQAHEDLNWVTALRPIAEMVRDIDLKDEKHGRAETKGLEVVINAIAIAHRADEVRLERSSALFDDLYEYFKRKRRLSH